MAAAAKTGKEVARELSPLVKQYTDGSVERSIEYEIVPPRPDIPDPETGVLSKDIIISKNPSVSARIFLPSSKLNAPQNHKKLPILIYFHGGSFVFESAFSYLHTRYVNHLVAEAQVLAISVDYRLAPEHNLPAAYDDAWSAFEFISSHHHHHLHLHLHHDHKEQWLIDHGDFDRLFIGGDSAGANIVHNLIIKVGTQKQHGHGHVKIFGAFLGHPYFWGSKPVGNEPTKNRDQEHPQQVWGFAFPAAANGLDNYMVNPIGPGAPNLANLGCSKLFVYIAEKDEYVRERGVWYYQLVKESEWSGELEELFETKGEGHCFHSWNCDTGNAKALIKRVASFLRK